MATLPLVDPSGPRLGQLLAHVGAERVVRSLIDLHPDSAVFVVDEERHVVAWSSGAERLLGYSASEVVGEHCLKANRCERCMRGCGLIEQGTIRGAPLTLYRKDHGAVRVVKYAQAFTDDDGRFLGGVELLVEDEQLEAPPPADRERVVFHGMSTQDAALKGVFDVVKNVAQSDVTVLVRGESGTGKELLARALHEESARRDGPFVAVNCAAISPHLLESTLFGHEKGAFTGAIARHRGVFEQAHGGTLFLDEVAELPLPMQASLLRALQERTFTRVGGTEVIRVDVRILSATHRSLRRAVEAGEFREDLMFRLRVVPLFLPPLRSRPSDVRLLAEEKLAEICARGPRPSTRTLSPDAWEALLAHRWPGNVRELENVLEYGCAVAPGARIEREHLPPELREGAPAVAPPTTTVDEATRIRRALDDAGGHIGAAADALGMSRPTFWRKRKEYGI